eukprot:TRINITY_DN9525_c0_g1_i4.p1 TRINITY_DN9525_c0_g1~~TRINITY_DN9525_c0_g1_i4.p1  ORF type:complete len:238 (-),score=-42.81 TRINITY_DN9525_c0_g1_i4:113-826(-)
MQKIYCKRINIILYSPIPTINIYISINIQQGPNTQKKQDIGYRKCKYIIESFYTLTLQKYFISSSQLSSQIQLHYIIQINFFQTILYYIFTQFSLVFISGQISMQNILMVQKVNVTIHTPSIHTPTSLLHYNILISKIKCNQPYKLLRPLLIPVIIYSNQQYINPNTLMHVYAQIQMQAYIIMHARVIIDPRCNTAFFYIIAIYQIIQNLNLKIFQSIQNFNFKISRKILWLKILLQ